MRYRRVLALYLAAAGCTLLLAGCALDLRQITPTPTATRTPRPAVTTVTAAATAAPVVVLPTATAPASPPQAIPLPAPPLQPELAPDEPPPTSAVIASVPTIARPQPTGGMETPAPNTPEAVVDPAPAASAAAIETAAVETATVEPTVTEAAAAEAAERVILPPAPLEGDLDSAYPATLDTPRFLLHYTPGSVAAEDPGATAARVQAALEHLERIFGRTLPGGFDVYAAGSLFAPPDQALRGRSFSSLRRLFFLQDGSGSAWDQQYIVGHELTHLYLWNAAGAPSSVMLSEGAAVYAGSKLVAGQGPLPLAHICLAYARAGALPDVAGDLSYQGHIRDLENYYTAGCFVQYLVETYGVDAFVQLYPTSDYWGIYGKSLAALAGEWQAQLQAAPDTLPFDPVAFVAAAERIKQGYRDLFAAFSNTPEERALYAQLDHARTELLAGRFE